MRVFGGVCFVLGSVLSVGVGDVGTPVGSGGGYADRLPVLCAIRVGLKRGGRGFTSRTIR